ncbi:MAG: hypothetical protein OXQ94_02325 [Gemmatimonadota bacterium]|nr:hypothetical protein [Gemmatimonadota bacterium]MDE2870516.1 hypothetical protein [Gemmatimonadota bacterium]
MIRVPGKAALALLQAISAAFVVSSRDGHAQDRPGDRAQSMAALGAAVAEAQRSPFHRVGTAGSVIAPGARVAIVPPRGVVLRETERVAATDEASTSDVFLATAITAHLTHIVGYLFVGAAIYGNMSETTAKLLFLSGAGLAALGTSLPAAILWRNFGRSLAGSALGVVIGPLVGVGLGKAGVPFLPAYSLGALVHAGAITLVAADGS